MSRDVVKMAKLLKTIEDKGNLIWREGFLYPILSEQGTNVILGNELDDNLQYGLSLKDLNKTWILFRCEGTKLNHCLKCRYGYDTKDKIFLHQKGRNFLIKFYNR